MESNGRVFGLEGTSTNILANHLRLLEELGFVEK
jgi:DNA-binding HxlR family transcriptional regulator